LTQTRLCVVHFFDRGPFSPFNRIEGTNIMMTSTDRRVTGGFDTHLDTNIGAVFDSVTCRVLARASFPTTTVGHQAALDWLREHGRVDVVGVESTGSYGAGLARHLASADVRVIEVNRTERIDRRLDGKDDYLDAESAGRAVLSGRASAIPKSGDGPVEAVRALEIAHRSAIHDRTEAINQFKSLLVRAPNLFRDVFGARTFRHQLDTASRFHNTYDGLVEQELRAALKLLAKRIKFLEAQIAELDERLRPILAEFFPALLGLNAVGVHSAAQLLMTAGDNPERLHSDAAFAKLCGACPQPASSGKTERHRLDRGGDRQANKALFRIVLVRMRHHEPTRVYFARRTSEGLSKREIIRCLKRFVAREVFNAITKPPANIPTGADLRAARISAGITLTALAIVIGVAPTNISRLERGIDHNTTRIRQALHQLTKMTT
jgi:transposase